MRRVGGACVECARLNKLDWRERNPERVKALKLAEQKRNRASANARNRRYAETHRQELAAKNAAWAKANPAKASAKTMRYLAAKLKATPPWADHTKINRAYELCAEYRAKGIDCHVDHIIPLQGKRVCGLHVQGNFQILGRGPNQSKSNRF